MLWNKLEYVDQVKIIDKIVSLLETEEDPIAQDGLMAAIYELEIWSNSPVKTLDVLDGENVVIAIDSIEDNI